MKKRWVIVHRATCLGAFVLPTRYFTKWGANRTRTDIMRVVFDNEKLMHEGGEELVVMRENEAKSC